MSCEHNFIELGTFREGEITKAMLGCSKCGTTPEITITESIDGSDVFADREMAIAHFLKAKKYPHLTAIVFQKLLMSSVLGPEGMADAIIKDSESVNKTFFNISLLWISRMSYYLKEHLADGNNEHSVMAMDGLNQLVSADKYLSEIERKVMSSYPSWTEPEILSNMPIEMTSSSKEHFVYMDRVFELDFILMFDSFSSSVQNRFSQMVFLFLANMNSEDELLSRYKETLQSYNLELLSMMVFRESVLGNNL